MKRGKPVERRGRKASGLSAIRPTIAGLPLSQCTRVYQRHPVYSRPCDSPARHRVSACACNLISKTALARRVIAVLTCLAILVVPQAPAVAAPGCKSKRACRDGPPTIEGIPSGQVTAGQTYSFTPTATDPEGKSLSFSIVNRPVWLNFNSSTGSLSGLPAASAVGEYIDISIQASDGRSTATLGPFSITVRDANRAPMIGGAPPTAAREGQFYRVHADG